MSAFRARSSRSVFPFLISVISLLVIPGCTARRIETKRDQLKEFEFQQHVNEADDYFRRLHLYGWRQAETSYQKALEVKESREILDKLRLTRTLRLIREKEEGIYRTNALHEVSWLCGGKQEGLQSALCDLSNAYFDPKRKNRQNRNYDEVAPFLRDWNPILTPYLALLTSKYERARDSFVKEFSCSPLAQYVQLQRDELKLDKDIEKHYPYFSEFLVYKGTLLLGKKDYLAGVSYLTKALELIPDYTKALTAIGNFYLFTVLDAQKALDQFERALSFDPANPAALFGKAVALHHLDRHADSNLILELLLYSKDRWEHFEGTLHDYYRDQSHYYKAWNYYLIGDLVQARVWTDRTKKYQSESENVNYLSGLIHFSEDSFLDRAEILYQVM